MFGACFQKRCHNSKVVYFSSLEPIVFIYIVVILIKKMMKLIGYFELIFDCLVALKYILNQNKLLFV